MTYHEVHKMHREGSSVRKISDHLGLNWRTGKKLLSKDDRSYQKELEGPCFKKKLLDAYRNFVREKLELHNDTSAAQMFDWLKEYDPDFPGSAPELFLTLYRVSAWSTIFQRKAVAVIFRWLKNFHMVIRPR